MLYGQQKSLASSIKLAVVVVLGERIPCYCVKIISKLNSVMAKSGKEAWLQKGR